MNYNEITRRRIYEALKTHKFSDRAIPNEVIITTKYDGCRQEIKIDFKELQDDIRRSKNKTAE